MENVTALEVFIFSAKGLDIEFFPQFQILVSKEEVGDGSVSHNQGIVKIFINVCASSIYVT